MSPASSKDWALSTHAWESVNASKHTHKESFIRISLSHTHTHTHTLTHSLMHEHWRRRVSRLPTQTNRPAVITHEQVFSFFFFSCLSFEIFTCRYPSRFPLYQVNEYRVFRIYQFNNSVFTWLGVCILSLGKGKLCIHALGKYARTPTFANLNNKKNEVEEPVRRWCWLFCLCMRAAILMCQWLTHLD